MVSLLHLLELAIETFEINRAVCYYCIICIKNLYSASDTEILRSIAALELDGCSISNDTIARVNESSK